MAHADALGHSESGMEVEGAVESGLLERRRYHREYMRRRRSDPQFDAREKTSRDRRRLARKLQMASSGAPGDATNPNARFCALCGLRASTTEIVRLRIVEDSPGGYVKVRIPYCGQC